MLYRIAMPLLLAVFGFMSWYHYEITKNKLATFEKIVTHKSIRLWTQNAGSRNKPACVFIPGAGASARFWSYNFLKQIVDSGYYTIILDNRDTGLSSAINYSKNPYTAKDIANDIIEILNAYNIKKAHIIGHSMGGAIAQIIAAEYPKRVLSITSISGGNIGEKSHTAENTMNNLIQNKPNQDFKESLPILMNTWKNLNGSFELDKKLAYKYTKDLYERSYHPIEVAWSHILCMKGFDKVHKKLAYTKIPCLFVHGAEDPLIPTQNSIEAAQTINNAKLRIIPCMGYTIFNRTLEDKLAKILIKHFKQNSYENYECK